MNDIFPAYTDQDLSAFTVLMLHRAASRLGLTQEGTNLESEMRTRIEAVRPSVVSLIDQTMAAYADWAEAKQRNADSAALAHCQERVRALRQQLTNSVSN